MIQAQKIALPYALFFIGFIVGFMEIVNILIGIPIHETGHVLAAFGTGGYGAWNVAEWNEAIVYGGHDAIISAGGVYFEVILGTAMASVLLVFRRFTFVGGMMFALAVNGFYGAPNQKDFTIMRKFQPEAHRIATQSLDILMVISFLIIILALALSIGLLAHKLTRQQT